MKVLRIHCSLLASPIFVCKEKQLERFYLNILNLHFEVLESNILSFNKTKDVYRLLPCQKTIVFYENINFTTIKICLLDNLFIHKNFVLVFLSI